MTDKNSNQYAGHLKMLKEKLEGHTMSALIGAGFSKNFNEDVFPNWWELIFEMVREGLETELSDRYIQIFPKRKPKGKNYEAWLKERIKKHIENVGPLEAVSEFIKRKGYREAVDVRIEKQTPIIEVENEDRYIRYITKGKEVRQIATFEEFHIHRKLVQLPWNNIYTTNYDNLLENSLDISIAKDFQSEIDELKGRIAEHQQNLDSQRKELEKVNRDYDALNDHSKASPVKIESLPMESGAPLNIDGSSIDELTVQKKKIKRNILFSESRLKRLDERLADFERNLGQLNGVVTHSSQLSIKKNGNIIKIHGSVRNKENLGYGFDSDARMHYVISKEDYADYPEKHEAFTQLMRISLLQEAFCLLGFSGIDPNFLSWIGWVRDVIERIKINSDAFEPKIYLIDVHDKPADSEKELFYLNHRITFIPLGHPDCLRFLEEEVGRKLQAKPRPREVVELFLDYLGTDMQSRIQIAIEQFKQERYDKIWRKLNLSTTPSEGLDIDYIFQQARELSKLRKYNRIPSNAHDLSERYHTIQALPHKLKQFRNEPEQLYLLIGFIAQILSEQYLFLRDIFEEEEEDEFLELVDLAKATKHPQFGQLLLIQLRDAVWRNEEYDVEQILKQLKPFNEEDIKQEVYFLKTLFAFFNLRFTEAEHLLSTWKTNDHWTVKKAGFFLLIDSSEAMKLLQSLRLETVQEKIYQLQLLAFGSIAMGIFEQRTKYVQQYKDIIHEGLHDTTEQLEDLLRKLSNKKSKIVPYGYNKFTRTRTIDFGGGNEWAYSQIFFRLLADLGYPLALPRLTLYDPVKIHPPLFFAFPNMPYAVIFYLFQYSDEKLVIKLAQDYATSEKVAEKVLTIYDRVRAMYHDKSAKQSFRRNGLHFLSELINVIEPNLWEDFFLEVWGDLLNQGSLLSSPKIGRNYFIEKALHLFQLPETAVRVVGDLLTSIRKNEKPEHTSSAIRFLYELNYNSTIRSLGEAGKITLDADAIETLTQKLPEKLDLLFVLGNLDFAMSDAQRMSITKVLREAPQLVSSSDRIWRIVHYFANDDSVVVQKIKTAILESPKLWDAGFTETGITASYNYIRLSQLTKSIKNPGLFWNPKELEVIYSKLKVTLKKIEAWTEKKDRFTNFKDIAEEMSRFMNAERGRLTSKNDYQEVSNRIITLLEQEKNYDQLMEGLLSDVNEVFTGAIEDLFYQLYISHQFGKFVLEIRTVLNRILLQSEAGLAIALDMVANLFYNKRNEEELRTYSELLLAILRQYRKKQPETIDKPYLETKLITLSLVLKEWEHDTPDITHYLSLIKNSRFMEIRYNLKYLLKYN